MERFQKSTSIFYVDWHPEPCIKEEVMHSNYGDVKTISTFKTMDQAKKRLAEMYQEYLDLFPVYQVVESSSGAYVERKDAPDKYPVTVERFSDADAAYEYIRNIEKG